MLKGKTAHASMPETGTSPMPALARLMPALTSLSHGTPPAKSFSLVTVTHATMGAAAFGIAPGRAELWATLRSLTDARMETLVAQAERLARQVARSAGLSVEIVYEDIFASSTFCVGCSGCLSGRSVA